MEKLQIGDIVEASYNSGKYIGKIIDDKRNFWLVEVHAVTKHPEQGDLHKRGQVEGVAFHERKALAFREKTNVRKRDTIPYTGEVPDYAQSLKESVAQIKNELHKEATPFNKLSLAKIANLEKYFYNKIFE